MTEIFADQTGKILARDPAGGQGGGVTSWATREPTVAELTGYHDQQVAASEAALASAKTAHAAHAEVAKKAAAADKKAADEAKAAEAKAADAPGGMTLQPATRPLPPVPSGVPLQPAPAFAPRPPGL
jgi:hypothetical protein